ncbi:MAG: ATP-binding protein [Myxococcota bacterium]
MIQGQTPAYPSRAPFVGRSRELATLLDALSAARARRGSLYLVSGEPGIGKTRLAEELAERAQADGAQVVWGAAWDGGGAPAYWPWIQILRALRERLPEPGDALKRDLGPLWSDSVSSEAEEVESRSFRRYDALRAVLAMAAERCKPPPLVLVLDDLHAADQGTLTALSFLSRQLRALPLLLIGTHRDAEARMRPDVGALLDRIGRAASKVRLGRLRHEDVAELSSGLDPLAPIIVDRIYSTSGGNPFFANEVLRLVRSGASAKDIPEAVQSVIAERLAQLDAGAHDMLEALAVLGREAHGEILEAVCGRPRLELADALASCARAGMVEQPEPELVSFAHPLFRECVYQSVSAAQKARLHLRAGEVLLDLGERSRTHSQAAARHLLLALPEGDPQRAIAQARSAALDCVKELSFDRAVDLLEGALSALGPSSEPELRSDIELELAEALVLVGHGERARRICAGVAERARRSSDAQRLTRAALGYGSEIRVAVVDPLQIELLEAALAALGSSDSALRAKLLARLAGARQPDPNPQSPLAQAFEAIELARASGDSDALLHALHTGGAALTGYAPPARRREVSRELAHLALARGDLVLAQRGYARWAIDAAELGNAEELAQALQAEERLGRTLGHPRFRWQSALLASMRALIEGRWTNSEQAIERAARHVAELEDAHAEATLAVHRLCALRTRMATLPEGVEASSREPPFRDNELDWYLRQISVASVQARRGEFAAARRGFERILPLPAYFPLIPAALVSATDAAVRVAHVETTRALLPHVEALPFPAVTWGASGFSWEGFTSDLIGRAELLLGNHENAVVHLEKAIEAAELFGARVAALESSMALAAALWARNGVGDEERAKALLDAATENASELSLTGALRRIEGLRNDTGATTSRASRTDAPRTIGLIREGEVWTLTSAGRSLRLKHSRALEILKQLLDNPGREFHVLDLGAKPDPDAQVDLGDAGELIDPAALSAYRKRSQALREELAEAESWNDRARRERVSAELEFLQDELRRGVALGAKPRRASNAAERARVNVTKRLKGVIARVAAELPDVAHHLEASISTGISVAYRPQR